MGNRVEVVPGVVHTLDIPAEGTNTNNQQLRFLQYRLVAPHHKSERHRNRPIDYLLPQDLCLLLDFHIKHGLKIIMSSQQDTLNLAYSSMTFLFVMPTTRKPLLKQQVSQVWKRVVLPEAYRFGPQVARSAFATGIRNSQLIPRADFSTAAAAEAMGHTLQVWNNTYDKLYMQQAVQRSVDALGQWREQVLLQQAQAAAQRAAAEAVAAATGAADADDEGTTAVGAEAAAAALQSDSDG